MTLEQKFFLTVLKDHLHEKETEKIEGIDYKKLFGISFSHRMTSIVYYQCKDIIPEKYIGKYRSVFFIHLATFSRREELIEKIKEAFNNYQIKYAIVKGPFAAKYYPVKEIREMGDLDIVVENETTAGRALESFGMERIPNTGTQEIEYKYKDLQIEIRGTLVYKGTVIGEDKFDNFFDTIWEYVRGGELDESFHFLVLVRHLRKHMANGGVGFRLFYDLATQIKFNDSLDWNWIEEKLKELKIDEFAGKCFAFIDKWFDVKAPILPIKLSDDFYNESTEIIFENGIFGFGNADNDGAFEANKIMTEKHPKLAMIKNATALAFPPYETLRKKYDFVDGRPFLLPVAWVYRIVDSLSKGKGSDGMKSIESEFVSQEKIEERKELYKKWGL